MGWQIGAIKIVQTEKKISDVLNDSEKCLMINIASEYKHHATCP